MSTVDFRELSDRVLALYGQRRYEEALALCHQALSAHPHRSGRVLFWTACLQSRLGRSDEAVATLHLVDAAEGSPARCWILTGDRDYAFARTTGVAARLAGVGVRCECVVVPSLGQDFSDDFGERLPDALEFLLSGSG